MAQIETESPAALVARVVPLIEAGRLPSELVYALLGALRKLLGPDLAGRAASPGDERDDHGAPVDMKALARLDAARAVFGAEYDSLAVTGHGPGMTRDRYVALRMRQKEHAK